MSPDPGRPFTVEPWHVREPKLDMDAIGAGRVGLRAVQRPHRAARQPRRGRAARHPRHLPQLVLREAPAAVRRGRVRLPRVRPDDHQRHQRQADPPAGRGRAVRPALRRAAPPRAGAGPAGGHAHPRGRVGIARRRAVKVRSVRMVSLTQRADRGDPLRGRGVDGPALLVVQSELVANEQLPARAEADPRVEAALTDPLVVRAARHARQRRLADPPDPPVRAAGGRRDGPRGRGAREAQGHLRGHARTSAAPR